MNELEAFAILASMPGLGASKIRQLVDRFGCAVAAVDAPAAAIASISGCEKAAAHWNRWQRDHAWKKDLDLAAKLGARLIPFTSPAFPKALRNIADHPALLYVRGDLRPQDQQSIAVVGTRAPTIYGHEMAEHIAQQLAAAGFTVVSGLARGVDTAAHRGALRAGRTLAIIGSGLANIYPAENRGLADEIAHTGALISEFPMDTPPDRQNFPQRNRIVSGLTLGTLLIEAPTKSGAMITMERAWSQERKLFALPGRADSDSFRGNHLLIKQGKAALIESAADIIAHFQEFFPVARYQLPPPQASLFDAEEAALLAAMPNEELTLEALAAATQLPISQLLRILMGLMLKKAVKEFPGKIFKKSAAGNSQLRHNTRQ